MLIKWILGIIIVGTFWAFTWLNIDRPASLNFDEFHYVTAAKTFLSQVPLINLEHPPLGKWIISWGISLLGDVPQGWRLMCILFGALTLGGVYLWALILFQSIPSALFVAVLSISNQMLYVQSRIGMLDTFMTAFLIWAGLSFSYWWKNRNKNSPLILSGIFFGLALGTKWFAAIPIGVAVVLVIKSKPKLSTLALFGLPIFVTYVLSFWPMAQHNGPWSQFLQWQVDIWSGQQRVPNFHSYQSNWWTWPLELRPIWYSFEMNENKEMFRGVVLLGNPLILWGGLVALVQCAWLAWKRSCRVSTEILLIYAVCLFGWALVPRKLMFFYYYYPAALILGFALVRAWEAWRVRLGKYYNVVRWSFVTLTIGCFLFFLPILSARPVPINQLWRWMWFSGWV